MGFVPSACLECLIYSRNPSFNRR